MIDVRKLGMLAALDRLGTVAAVADEYGLSGPGVSMQLAALEKELGLELTERNGRRLALTAAGRVLADHGHEIVDRVALAEHELTSLRTGTVGRYTLAAFPSAARTFVATACRRVIGGELPAIELGVTTQEPDDALDAILSGDADLAVVHSYSNVAREAKRGVVTHPLGTEPVWLATRLDAGTIRDDAPARLEDFEDSPWITPESNVSCFAMVERACGLAGFRPRSVAQSMDFAVQLELVAAGMGVALVPDLTVDRVPDGVVLRRTATPIVRTIHVATRSTRVTDPGILRLSRLIEDEAHAELATRARALRAA